MTATPQRTAMQQPVPAPDEQSRSRTPLALAPAPARRSGRGFFALCVGILSFALLAALLVNIVVANRQYDLVGLKGEQLALTQANERLRQQVEHLQAPQNLAAKASELGMVMPEGIASIDLSTGKVSGAVTATADDAGSTGGQVAPGGPDAPAAVRDGHLGGTQATEAGRDLHGGTIPAPTFSAGGTD